MNFRSRHLLLAFLLHGLLFTCPAFSVRCSPVLQPPAVIQGVLLDPNREQLARQQQAQAEQQRAAEAQRVKQEQELQAAREQEQIEKERLVKEQQEKVQKETLKKKQELEKRKKVEEKTEKEKATDQERQKKEEQRRKIRERQREMEKAEQELRNQQLQTDAEAASQALAQRKANDALAEWIGLVTAQVKRNWLRPPDSSDNFECKVQIEQLPGGQIVSRKMVQSCGNRLLDDSVLKAVDKSDPLPLVSDPAAFRRSFTFSFVPK